jgi:hypothetical protein
MIQRVQFTLQSLAFQLRLVQPLLDLLDLLLPAALQLLALASRHIPLAAHLLQRLLHFPHSNLQLVPRGFRQRQVISHAIDLAFFLAFRTNRQIARLSPDDPASSSQVAHLLAYQPFLSTNDTPQELPFVRW